MLEAGVRGSGGSASGSGGSGGPKSGGRPAGVAVRSSHSPKVRRTPMVKAVLLPLPQPESQPPVF